MLELKEAIRKSRGIEERTAAPQDLTTFLRQLAVEIVNEKFSDIERAARDRVEILLRQVIEEYVEKIRGKKGDPGDKGDPGADATVDHEAVVASVLGRIPPVDIDAIKQRVLQEIRLPSLDEDKIARRAASLIELPDLSSFGEQLKAEIRKENDTQTPEEETPIEMSDVVGLNAFLKNLQRSLRESTSKMIHGGGVTFQYGTARPGIIIPVVDFNLVPNVSGTTFTLPNVPISPTALKLYRGGSRITQANGDYTYTSGLTGTLSSVLSVGETLTADLEYTQQ